MAKKKVLFFRVVSGSASLYDNASVVYSLRRPDMATKWTNAVLKIRRSNDDATAFVFFDGSAVGDTITLTSKINTVSNTTPDPVRELGIWVGANDAFVEQWIGITPNNTIDGNKVASQTTTTLQPRFINTGVVGLKNGKAQINFSAVVNSTLIASVNTDLNSGNSATILNVSSSQAGNLTGTVLGTTNITGGLSVFNDTTTNVRNTFLVATENGNANNLVRHNDTDQRLQSAIVLASSITSYYNGDFQMTDAWAGTYNNDSIRMGTRFGTTSRFIGLIQEIIIFPSDKTADLTALHADINAYYGIYLEIL